MLFRLAPFVISALASIASASSPLPPGWMDSEPYNPSQEELQSVIAAGAPLVPPSAQLLGASVQVVAELIPPTTMRETRYHHYRFLWPSNRSVRGLRFWDRAYCLKADEGDPECFRMPQVASRRSGESFTLESALDDLELRELLAHFEAFPVPDTRIVSLRKDEPQHSGTLRTDMTNYRIIVVEDGTYYGYDVLKKCRSYTDCHWSIDLAGKVFSTGGSLELDWKP